MNQKLPKPMLDGLAQGVRPADHPSADLLAAFVERTLAEGENRSVSDHLARCGECREVVFLASGAAEESDFGRQVAPAAAARPRPRWLPHLAWAVPAASLLLVIGGYFAWHPGAATPVGTEIASKAASEAPIRPTEQSQSAASAPPVVAAPMPGGTAARSAAPPRPNAKPATTMSAKRAVSEGAAVVVMNAAPPPPEDRSLRAKAEAAATSHGGPLNTTSGALGGIAPAPRASGFAPSASENEARQFGAPDSLSLSVNRAVTGATRGAHPGWRITAQGQLEHITPDGWTNAVPEQSIVFRSVSVMGDQVWAGGDGGALFQSGDRGAHWTRITLGSPGDAETSGIVSIRFDDPRHGVVVTASGSIYRTSDGGVTWAKQ